jgi:hypothetical protein
VCGTEACQNDCSEYGLETRLEEDGKGNARGSICMSSRQAGNFLPSWRRSTLSESTLGLQQPGRFPDLEVIAYLLVPIHHLFSLLVFMTILITSLVVKVRHPWLVLHSYEVA